MKMNRRSMKNRCPIETPPPKSNVAFLKPFDLMIVSFWHVLQSPVICDEIILYLFFSFSFVLSFYIHFFFLLFVLNILHTTAAGFLFVAHNPAPFKSQFYSHMELNELYLFT